LRILVSSDVAEEIVDLAALLEAMPGNELALGWHAPTDIPSLLPEYSVGRSISLRHRNGRLSLLRKATELVRFISVAFRFRPDVLLSGSSMLKHRLAARMLGVPHVAYFRGLMFDPSIRSGYSDKIRLGRLGRYLRTDLFDATRANHILTVAETNRQFLLQRGADDERITLIGPIWLDGISPNTSGERRVYFLTSALAAHGFTAEHRAQVTAVMKVATSGAFDPLIVRVHPRDFYDYEADPTIPASVEFDRSPPLEFLRQLRTDDILVTPLSTLAFEAQHLGCRVLFYSSPELGNHSAAAFATLGIGPVTLDELLEEGALDSATSGRSIFSPANQDALRTVLARVLESGR
jgi:hypothetical protein